MKKLVLVLAVAVVALAMPATLVAQDTGSLGSAVEQYDRSGKLLGDNRNAAEELVQVWNGLALAAEKAISETFAGKGSLATVKSAEGQVISFGRDYRPRFAGYHFVLSRLHLATAFHLRGGEPRKCEKRLERAESELKQARDLAGEKGAPAEFLEALDGQERFLNQLAAAPGGGCSS
ncbi:MAG TPA: hypothetical protein VJ837_00530 [Candidatus Paceibacterota bacterium]|nr:hypothetical protein [Candidatus Paceibacterota bacterium]